LPLRKSVSHIKSLGCSVEFLKARFESMFYQDMTWENYGKVWEIDHQIPLVTAKTFDQLVELCKFTNLVPLLVEDHKIKTAKEKGLIYEQ
jgi:hypothetical protein